MVRYFIIFFVLTLQSSIIYSQSKCNTALLMELNHNVSAGKELNILVQYKNGQDHLFKKYPGTTFKYAAGNIASVTAPIEDIKKMTEDPAVIYMEYIRAHTQVMNDTMVYRNRLIQVKTGMAPLTQSYDGSGVIMVIIDSGIDFNHPDFKDASGNTRIKYLWDMTMPNAANTPTAYNYGQDWNNVDIDLGNCNHDPTKEWGHGTHVTSIAAGNGLAINHYEGVAPKSDIVLVALDFYKAGPTIADAVHYILDKTQIIGKPLVINASVGDYYGSHDATDLQSLLIDALIANKPGKCLVSAAGNAGAIPYHLGYDVVSADTSFTWFSNNTTTVEYWQYGDTNQVKNVKYSIGVNRPNYTDVGNTSFRPYNYALNTIKRDTIYKNSNRIGIMESSASINSLGIYELYVSIKPDSLNYLWRIENTGTGRIDAWNFDFKMGSLPTVSQYSKMTHYKDVDTNQTMVSGFQCSDEIITVANYVNRNAYVDYNGNMQYVTEIPKDIATSSSRGPTRTLQQKPDISASGSMSIAADALALLANMISTSPQGVAQGGYHVPDGGTSSASPMVAGLVALFLQQYPNATNQQIKQAIINCAYSDNYTTTNLPNYRWGYGKLDGYHAMICGAITTDAVLNEDNNYTIVVYPNPAKDLVDISFPDSDKREIHLYDLLGNEIIVVRTENDHYHLNISGLSQGMYVMEIQQSNKSVKKKIMVQ